MRWLETHDNTMIAKMMMMMSDCSSSGTIISPPGQNNLLRAVASTPLMSTITKAQLTFSRSSRCTLWMRITCLSLQQRLSQWKKSIMSAIVTEWGSVLHSISIHPSIHKTVPTYIHTSIHKTVPTYIHPSTRLYLPTYIHPSIHKTVPTYIHPYIYKTVPTYIHPSIHPYTRLYLPISIHPSTRLYLPISIHPSIHKTVPRTIHRSQQLPRERFESWISSSIGPACTRGIWWLIIGGEYPYYSVFSTYQSIQSHLIANKHT